MKKRLFLGVALLAFIVGIAVMSFAAPQLQPPVQKHKITLSNGTVMEGEIVAVTEKTISIKDASLGVVAIARENILKIEPPLDEETGAAPTPPPPPAATPRYVAQPYARQNNGIKFGFSLSGGLGMINGGDFNQNIRDWNSYCADYNAYWEDNYYSIDWKEMKSVTDFKGEILARFGKNFGVGIGVEFINKTHPGTYSYTSDDSYTLWYGSYYYMDIVDNYKRTVNVSDKVSIIPITLNIYYYLPLGNTGEIYVNVGPGYYLGSIKSDYNWDYNDVLDATEHYYTGALLDTYHETYVEEDKVHYTATCNTIGFHFGLGFNFNLGHNLALFGEGLYRLASFKDWSGSANETWNYTDTWGWQSDGSPTVKIDDGTETWKGDYWYYEYVNKNYTTKNYGRYDLFEEKPDETSSRTNIRKANFDFGGIVIRVGIKFFFGGN